MVLSMDQNIYNSNITAGPTSLILVGHGLELPLGSSFQAYSKRYMQFHCEPSSSDRLLDSCSQAFSYLGASSIHGLDEGTSLFQ